MAAALDPAGSIYEGIWINWSEGSVWGLTWTLCPTQATILTNSLALFTTVAGIQLWTVLRYAIHYLGTRRQQNPSTPHHTQQQLILRNAGGSFMTARLMLPLAWYERLSTGERSWRAYAIGAIGIFHGVLFMIAGIFSNKAVATSSINGGSAVVSRSPQCGIWNNTYFNEAGILYNNYSDQGGFDLWIQYYAKLADNVQLSLEYAQQCYISPARTDYMSSTCNTLKVPRLTFQKYRTACPFAATVCHQEADAVVMDTGYIDTHNDLGINSKLDDRLKYRKLTTCAVLNDTTYVTNWNGSIVSDDLSLKPLPETAYAYYGPDIIKQTNWTYSYSNFAAFFDRFTAQVDLPYQLNTANAMAPADPQYTESDFEPIEQLAQNDADLVLLFLSFTGTYYGEVDDPWFSAHRAMSFPLIPLDFLQNRYSRDMVISTIACKEQHQFCTHLGQCTALLGFDQVQNNETFNDALNPHQNATFDRVIRAVAASRLGQMLQFLQRTTTPMLASNHTASGSSGLTVSQPLPNDQWHLELNYWHSISMAQLQRTVVQWATGQIAPEPQYVNYLLRPEEERDKWFCENLIIPSDAFQSFSVVSIVLLIAFGTFVIIAGLTIRSMTMFIRKHIGRPVSRDDWDRHAMLGLQGLETINSRSTVDHSAPSGENSTSSTGRDFVATSPVDLEMQTMSAGANSHRISSQVLPAEAFTFSFPSIHTGTLGYYHSMDSPASPRVARPSWTAISLTDLDLATRDTSIEISTVQSENCSRYHP